MSTRIVGIAGTGRMAGALAQLLGSRGWQVAAVRGRGAVGELPGYANRILVAVSDDAIGHVGAELAAGGLRAGTVLHTSGAAGPEALAALREHGTAVGVMHPLQTVPTVGAGVAGLPGSFFAVAGDEAACLFAREIIGTLDGTSLEIDPAGWPIYHAAAVVASNYQVTLTDVALEMMQSAGVSRQAALQALAPLILSAASNTIAMGPEAALTGPVRRGDEQTIRGHLRSLRAAPKPLQRLYAALGLRCVELARRAGLPADNAERIADVFRTEGAITETAETDS